MGFVVDELKLTTISSVVQMINLFVVVNEYYNKIDSKELSAWEVDGFNVYGSVHRKNILIYIQQDATLHSFFYLETALHVSGGTSTHHQERKQLYLQHLILVRPLLPPAASGR